MRRTAATAALVLAALACVCLLAPAPVSAAGHNPSAPRTPPREDHPRTFPTKEEIANNPELQEKYGGDNKLIVHVVPHTHDDVGWLKTVDQYFLGANNSIQHAAVKYILDTVVEELAKNPERHFIYVEQAFFQLWYARQTPAVKATAQSLIKNGQLEFINGGWCMHDEAATHFIDMVDQTTLGHQFILSEFGAEALPKVTWQIDPFGHSGTQAALLSAAAGYEGLFFGRIDHQDHDQRMKAKNMEFVWRASPSLGQSAQVFTGAFQNGNYGPPNGFCFDAFCGDAPMISDPSFIDNNIDLRVQQFLDQINYQASFTRGVNLMITMGSDFQYENAREWYENLDVLIAAVNKDGRVQAQYSTPSKYVEAKNKEQLQFTVKTDDFFPYADGDHAYWTGYFVSRPALKRYVRTSSALLQTARQLDLFAGGDGSSVFPLEKAVGVAQHHDAVAGTAKQHVAFDYAQRLHIAQATAQDAMTKALADFTTEGKPASASVPQFAFCELANISICAATASAAAQGQAFQVTLYNPLARTRTELASFPIANAAVLVADQTGAAVQAQVLNVFNVSSHAPESLNFSVNFVAEIPPLGYRTYFISPASADDLAQGKVFMEEKHLSLSARRRAALGAKASTFVSAQRRVIPGTAGAADVVLSNSLISLTVSGSTGQVSALLDKQSGASTPFTINYGYYNAYVHDQDHNDEQNGGAYIFRPAQQYLNRISVVPQLLVQTGPLVQQVTQLVNQWLNHTLRVVVNEPRVEVEYTVGEVPIADNIGKEVVIQYTSSVESSSTWYSDSNAREMQPRVRNQRFSYVYNVTEPISGNYVPITAAAFITDGQHTFTVLNDRAQGVASLQDGQLELMIHRRLLADDSRGVGEPLNETQWMSSYASDNPHVRSGPGLVITGTHYLYFTAANHAASQWRPATTRVYAPLTYAFAPLSESVSSYIAAHNVEMAFAAAELPLNVELISLQSWGQWVSGAAKDNTVMLRLAHSFAVGEDATLSQPASFDLASFFSAPPKTVQQMSLTITKPAAQAQQKLHWNTEGDNQEENLVDLKPSSVAGTVVTLNAMEVQSFLLTF